MWRETSILTVSTFFFSISIHSLRVEGDVIRRITELKVPDFNPLPPCGGRLTPPSFGSLYFWISIHSLRVEGDGVPHQAGRGVDPISIHSLRVEGDIKPPEYTVTLSSFQSTPSVWRETVTREIKRLILTISIHSLRVEGDGP